jgi:hypothetical protein
MRVTGVPLQLKNPARPAELQCLFHPTSGSPECSCHVCVGGGGGDVANLNSRRKPAPAITGRRHRDAGSGQRRTLAGCATQQGSGAAASQRAVPASRELAANAASSRSPARGSSKDCRKGRAFSMGFTKDKVCNLAAVCHTPCPSCPRGGHLKPRALRVQKPKRALGRAGALDSVSTGGAARDQGKQQVGHQLCAQRAPAVGKQQPQRKGSPTLPRAHLKTRGPVPRCAGHTHATFNKRKQRPRFARRDNALRANPGATRHCQRAPAPQKRPQTRRQPAA